MKNRKEFILDLVKEAQSIIKERINESYQINIKNNNQSDLVTAVDVEIEKLLVSRISDQFPEDGFLTEEKTVPVTEREYVWIIDPIDGTMNFVYTLSDFAISVALYHKGIGVLGVILDVMKDELFVGVKGEGATLNGEKLPELEKVTLRESIVDVSLRTMSKMKRDNIANLYDMAPSILSHRNLGSAALRIAHIASGRIHMYISDTLCIWDFAAGIIILEEVKAYHNYLEDELKFDSSHVDFFASNNENIMKEIKENYYINM